MAVLSVLGLLAARCVRVRQDQGVHVIRRVWHEEDLGSTLGFFDAQCVSKCDLSDIVAVLVADSEHGCWLERIDNVGDDPVFLQGFLGCDGRGDKWHDGVCVRVLYEGGGWLESWWVERKKGMGFTQVCAMMT